MIIPSTALPNTERHSPEQNAQLLEFCQHLGVLAPVMLQLEASTAIPGIPEQLLTDAVVAVPSYVEGFSFESSNIELACQLMDQGLLVAFFPFDINGSGSSDNDHVSSLQLLESIPAERVGLVLTIEVKGKDAAPSLPAFIMKHRDNIGNFLIRVTSTEEMDISALLSALSPLAATTQIFFDLAGVTEIERVRSVNIAHSPVHFIVQASLCNTPGVPVRENPYNKNPPPPVPAAANTISAAPEVVLDTLDVFIGCLRSDRPDGMFATVVCDEHGVALGFVYSTANSLRAAFAERRGIYWSRSRGSLWRKGDTSGMHQTLHRIAMDCDQDALRFIVTQHGTPPAFCHLQTRSCWGAETSGLQKLERTLQERRGSAPPGSYTQRLFSDPDLLRKKLLEEAQELVEAETQDHIAAEAADLMYFLLVRCTAAGVGIADIEHHLDRRALKISRRPGNAKEWRTREAEKVLEGSK